MAVPVRPLVAVHGPEAAERASDGVDFLTDLYAGPEYRALLVRTYLKRALLDGLPALP